MPGYKKKLYYTNLNKFIRECVDVKFAAPVKFVEGYLDPYPVKTFGLKHPGPKEIIVGKLFLLGKIY